MTTEAGGAGGLDAGALVTEQWRRITRMRDEDIPLAEGALWIAAGEYPGLAVADYLGQLRDMADRLQSRLRADMATADKLRALNHYLFDELGFCGNSEHFHDPRNSFLNDVLDRRLGIPITLALVYIEIGRRIGIRLHGVSFPGHFLVKCPVRDGMVVLDPYSRGVSLDIEELQLRLRAAGSAADVDDAVLVHLLSAASNKEVLARVLRNLKVIYTKDADWLRALSASERLIGLIPDAGEEYRDRGGIYLKLECFRAALGDLGSYVRLCPGAPDIAGVRAQIADLAQRVARLN